MHFQDFLILPKQNDFPQSFGGGHLINEVLFPLLVDTLCFVLDGGFSFLMHSSDTLTSRRGSSGSEGKCRHMVEALS